MSQPQKPSQPNLSVEHSGTLLETDGDIRQALLAGIKGSPPPAGERPAVPYRPTSRPPIALLTVCDDGDADGEILRIRCPRFVIGRTHGDLKIPFDKRISSRHVEITQQLVDGAHRWVVTDLQSRHGLFVRVSRALLADKSEILVGKGRYRFDAAHEGAGESAGDRPIEPNSNATYGISEAAAAFRPAAITEILGQEEIGNRIVLVKPEYWIGTDSICHISRADDPFCEPRHARIYRNQNGKWYADHNKSRNGLWMRVPQVKVETTIQFQIGEQRFRLKML
jgi:hypothetical protein